MSDSRGNEPPRRIEVLDALVADQIAAGEVIERPASVVKELVENALDAGAREIRVEIAEGGRSRISVRDDGHGMTAADAALACQRHATSKLRRIEDLARIESLGFRGEALASIAAVADVTIATRARSEPSGVRLEISQGKVQDVVPTGVPVGTTVEVRDLFTQLPARRKFLRSPQTETAHITELLNRIALARPNVGFTCVQGSREVFRHPAVSRAEDRLRQVLGPARARVMLAVEHAEGPVTVRGWVSRGGESYAQARLMLTYVGGRLVRDRVLTRAVLDAYRALLPQGRYPQVVLRVDLPGTALDVNVHPTKSEVRFAQPDAIYGAMVRAVRAALAAGAVAPGKSFAAAAGGRDDAIAYGESRVAEALSRYAVRSDARQASATWVAAQASLGERSPRSDRNGVAPAPGDAEDAVPVPTFAELRVIGQAFGGYIVCESSTALILIDQHAAHERVRFERLRRAAGERAGSVPSQRLLVPRVVDLEESSCARLLEAVEPLAAAGFDLEPFGARTILLRSLPASLDVTTDADTLLAELAEDLSGIGASDRLAAARDTLLARIACHGAVRAGDPLADEEMTRLVADLDTIPFAATCPHGRPLLVELSRAELARRVRRT